jgi:hypothetical protein
MEFEDQRLICRDCGNDFLFTAGEQDFYRNKDFTNSPTRCPACRNQRKLLAAAGAITPPPPSSVVVEATSTVRRKKSKVNQIHNALPL